MEAQCDTGGCGQCRSVGAAVLRLSDRTSASYWHLSAWARERGQGGGPLLHYQLGSVVVRGDARGNDVEAGPVDGRGDLVAVDEHNRVDQGVGLGDGEGAGLRVAQQTLIGLQGQRAKNVIGGDRVLPSTSRHPRHQFQRPRS